MKKIILSLLGLVIFAVLAILFFWRRSLSDQFGPTIENLQVEQLDRNGNSKPDTLKISFELNSAVETIAFGSTMLCVGDEFGSYSCKTIYIHYPDESAISSGQDVLCVGKNPYTRYLYLDNLPKKQGKKTVLYFYMIGADSYVLQRTVTLQNRIDFSNYEHLQLGEQIGRGRDFNKLTVPIENRTVHLQGSCHCRFEHCEGLNDVELKANEEPQPIR